MYINHVQPKFGRYKHKWDIGIGILRLCWLKKKQKRRCLKQSTDNSKTSEGCFNKDAQN